MVQIRTFRALRPAPEIAANLVSLPYDVMDREEARAMAQGEPYKFLRITRSDLEFPDSVDQYDDSIYARAGENLRKFVAEGKLLRESDERLYIYRLNRGAHQQTGLVALSSIEDYLEDRIKKHELTRKDKERDRTVHIDRTGANTGPVFLLYNSAHAAGLAALMDGYADRETPLYDCTFDDGVRHRVYSVGPGDLQSQLLAAYRALPATYIADGHHRAASAVSVGKQRRERAGAHTGDELFNYFLSVTFPDNQLAILPYNRAVRDLNGRSEAQFLAEIEEKFSLRPGKSEALKLDEANLFLNGTWRTLQARPGTFDAHDPIESLMVSVLQSNLLAPTLGVSDPRTSDRIQFVGGIRGDAELEKLVNSGKHQVAFALPPVSTAQLISVSDAGKIMPPKSTWFEPKLRSGFLVHLIDG